MLQSAIEILLAQREHVLSTFKPSLKYRLRSNINEKAVTELLAVRQEQRAELGKRFSAILAAAHSPEP